jgi:hypothetical protein
LLEVEGCPQIVVPGASAGELLVLYAELAQPVQPADWTTYGTYGDMKKGFDSMINAGKVLFVTTSSGQEFNFCFMEQQLAAGRFDQNAANVGWTAAFSTIGLSHPDLALIDAEPTCACYMYTAPNDGVLRFMRVEH